MKYFFQTATKKEAAANALRDIEEITTKNIMNLSIQNSSAN
jgi:hypothetical protein